MKLIRLKQQIVLVLILAAAVCGALKTASGQTAVSPRNMKMLGEVGPRYGSYNVEAVEVTGGRFWAPTNLFPRMLRLPSLQPQTRIQAHWIRASNIGPRLTSLIQSFGS